MKEHYAMDSIRQTPKLNDYIHFEILHFFYIKSMTFKMYVVIQFGRFFDNILILYISNIGKKSYVSDKKLNQYS